MAADPQRRVPDWARRRAQHRADAYPYQNRHPDEIQGHPTVWLAIDNQPTLITVCAQCGELRTILFLNKDRWFCYRCKTEGASPPNLYPVA